MSWHELIATEPRARGIILILFDKLSLRQKFFALTALLLVTVGVLTVTQWEVDHAGEALPKPANSVMRHIGWPTPCAKARTT